MLEEQREHEAILRKLVVVLDQSPLITDAKTSGLDTSPTLVEEESDRDKSSKLSSNLAT